MWNSVLLDGVKWSFDRSSPPLMDDDQQEEQETNDYRSWDFKSHHQTNYADWTNRHGGLDDDPEDLFLRHDSVTSRTDNYPSAAELFRNFVGDEGADRMEFYINHLTMEGCDANIASALLAENETRAEDPSSSSANVVYRPPFPLLETITEETLEELTLDMSDSSSSTTHDESSESPSSNSGRWGWGWGWLNTSDDDSSSVIHVPVAGRSAATITSVARQSELPDIGSGIYRADGLDMEFDMVNDDEDDFNDDEWSERDHEVPKKKRRVGSSIDEEDEESTSSRSPSVTDSLIQFEALEKELGSDDAGEPVIFRTSATSLPFEDADEGALSCEVDPEVFLDCQEHNNVQLSQLLESSSGHSLTFLDDFQPPRHPASQLSTCGSFTLARTWSSLPSLDRNAEDESMVLRSRSACDMSKSDAAETNASGKFEELQGQTAALRPSQPWVITFDPPRDVLEEEVEEEEDDVDDNANDDDEDVHWEPDGFLNSDIEEYDSSSNSDDDDDDYSTERCDRFDEFGLNFISGRSQRMRSFRSYGDSLNLLDTTGDDRVVHSTSSSSTTSCSPDRSSPEEDHRHPSSSSRSRRSVEALSEDSGYGDASFVQRSPENRATSEELRMATTGTSSTPPTESSNTLELPSLTICPPDASPPSSHNRQWPPEVQNRAIRHEDESGDDDDEHWNEMDESEKMALSALLLRRQPRCRPTPLSLKEAEEFLVQDHAPEVIKGCESRCGVSEICIDLESKMSHTFDGNAANTTNDDILHRPGTDLEASKFNPQIGGSSNSSGWEVPDEVGEAAAADHQHTTDEKQHSLHSADGSDFAAPDAYYQHNHSSLGHNVTYSEPIAMDSAFYPAPVVLKRYGPRQEVEVYISQQQQQLPVDPAPTSSSTPLMTTVVAPSSIRGVHFSPVVSAVNWRESYLNQSEDESDSSTSSSSSNRLPPTPPPQSRNNSADLVGSASPLATKVRVVTTPSVPQRAKLIAEESTSCVNGPSDVDAQPSAHALDSGRNGGSNSCTTTSNSATTSATTTATTINNTTTTTNSKKPLLFQRFSLSRLSARMSATFSRSESKRESTKKASTDGPIPTDSVVKNVVVAAAAPATTSKSGAKKNAKAKQGDVCPAAAAAVDVSAANKQEKLQTKKMDDFKVVKEPKRRFFSRPFQRSSSTPPMPSVTAPEASVQTRATTPVDNNRDTDATSSKACHQVVVESLDQGQVTRQPTTTSSLSADDIMTPPAATTDSATVAAIDDSHTLVVVSSAVPLPVPLARKVQASHAKPPLPPQTKPRTIHARKNYLVESQQQQQQAAPPVPMVSSAGLQHALQHFKETARMERERLANSVPDLAAPPTPTPRPTSDCIDPRTTTVNDTAPAPQPATSTRPPVFGGSRERARQAVLSRASSVESAWNATASRAALNLSRRNIASSSTSSSQDGNTTTTTSSSTQGHGPTKSRPVVPGLLETNLDSVPSSYPYYYGGPTDETNLDELIQNLQLFCNNKRAEYSPTQPLSVDSANATNNADKRFKSMLNLGSSSAPVSVQPDIDMTDSASSSSVRVPDTNRAKSMEFLLDEDNKSTVQVPENQLKKCGERKMSEHELRIQRSLQKLNVPEWYKNNARPGAAPAANGTTSGVLRRRDYHGGSASLRNGGWSGLSSRDPGTTSSMTSLGSALSRSGTPTRVVIPTRVRPDWRNMKSSRESLNSPAADTCSSPSWNGPTSLTSAQQQSFSRWGSGRSSYSTCPSPAPSTSSSASAYRTSLLHQHGRQPYLGWRSQERLNTTAAPAPLSVYQSPAERLASTLVVVTKAATTSNNNESRSETESSPSHQQETDDVVRSSIRQVTSAIVHYVSESSDGDQPPSPLASRNGLSRSPERHPLEALSRSPSPRRQRCVWVESSFIGGSTGSSPTSRQHRPPSPIRPESPPPSSSSHHSHHHRSAANRPGESLMLA